MHEEQLRRYSRNIILPQIGEDGQKKLLSTRVLVVGAGGLGSPLLLYLAAAGIGRIGIIDGDRVDLSNLQRQIIHETSDINRPKVESSFDAIHDLNPDVAIDTYSIRLTGDNAKNIINKYDIVADGSDNIETRFLVNDICYELRKPLVSAAIHGFEGQLTTFKPYLGDNHPCYRCLYEMPPADSMPSCSESGVLGSLAGIMGSWQSAEIIKEILVIGESLSGWLILFDALQSSSRKIKIHKDSECILCRKK